MRQHPFSVTAWQHIFYVALPLLSYVLFLAWALVSPDTFEKYAGNEIGIIEFSHIFITIAGLVFAVQLCLLFLRKKNGWGVILSILASLVCLYIAGEEASYGQHVFEWDVDDIFLEINDQQESNLHNISSWFDQKPRAILELAIVLGGLLLPLFPAIMLKLVPAGLRDYAPTLLFLPTSILVVLSRLPERLNLEGIYMFPKGIRYSEIQEVYLFLFIALYLYFVLRLERSRKATL